MEFFIDGKVTGERTFWRYVDTLGSATHKKMILEGYKVRIAESLYWIQATR